MMVKHTNFGTLLAAAAIASVIACSACSGGSDNTMGPSEEPVAGTTVTITSSGVSPKNLLVAAGTQVTFVNNDSRSHDMQSDPHPEHTDCPAFNQVGFLTAGQSRQTGNLNTVRVCGYHDHNDAGNSRWLGQITIR